MLINIGQPWLHVSSYAYTRHVHEHPCGAYSCAHCLYLRNCFCQPGHMIKDEMCGSRKYHYTPHRRSLKIQRRGGCEKAEIFKDTMSLNWGGGVQTKKPSVGGGVWMFSGTTQYLSLFPFLAVWHNNFPCYSTPLTGSELNNSNHSFYNK